MKHRTLFLIVFALLQTCIAFAGTPFTKEEFQEMVRLFNQHQEANIKKPFDKWTTLPLINKPEGLEVVYLASDDEATGGFFFIDKADSTISVITTYTFPMKFAFYSRSIEGGKIGLKAKSGGACFSYWTYSVFPDKAQYYVFVNEFLEFFQEFPCLLAGIFGHFSCFHNVMFVILPQSKIRKYSYGQ